MSAPPERKSPGVTRGSDLRCQASDLVEQYTGPAAEASGSKLRLAYQRPAWKNQLERESGLIPPVSKRPLARWRGNIAYVYLRPFGFCIIELQPGEWALAVFKPHHSPVPLSCEGAPRAQAEAALSEIRAIGRPIYPAIAIGGAK